MIHTMAVRHDMYNSQKAYVRKKEEAGQIFVIRPTSPLNIKHAESNPDELQRVYELGRSVALSNLSALKAYIA